MPPHASLVLAFLCYIAQASSELRSNSTNAGVWGGHARSLLGVFPTATALPQGLLLPLTPRHNVARGRGLLRSGMLPVDGSVSEMG
jgi:hypothetical protein